jgi:hypothetical protein
VIRWKLATFAFSTAVFLLVQYSAVSWGIGGFWDVVLLLLLVHSVVMLTDAVCEYYDEEAPRWKHVFTGFLLPVEPRGIPNVLMMIGLFAAVALAVQIRGCAEARDAQPREPAAESRPEEAG